MQRQSLKLTNINPTGPRPSSKTITKHANEAKAAEGIMNAKAETVSRLEVMANLLEPAQRADLALTKRFAIEAWESARARYDVAMHDYHRLLVEDAKHHNAT